MSSHFYDKLTGDLIEGNLRDARKVGALPSPTTVLKILGSPALKIYFRRQMFESVATTPRLPGQSDDEYFASCCRWADEHGKEARDKGGDFHTLCQRFHEQARIGGVDAQIKWGENNLPMLPQFDAYMQWYRANVKRTIMVEQTVFGDGYGGRVDHVAQMMDGREAVLDVKTQDTKKKLSFTYYSEWPIQLGAYAGAIHPMPDCLISVAVSRNEPVRVEAKVWDKPPTFYHDIFLGLLKYWQLDNSYWP